MDDYRPFARDAPMKKPQKFDKKEWVKWKPIVVGIASQIESALDSFAIKGKVMAITLEDDYILFELSIAPGVKVEEVESLSRTIAMVIASPNGKVEMMGPLPGKSLIGIKVPRQGR